MADNSQNPHSTEWRILYQVAVFETDRDEMDKRISDAEDAIVERIRELFWQTGADVEGEREALDDAM